MLHKRRNITVPSTDHLKFTENMTFAEVLYVKRDKKRKCKIRTLYIFKVLNTWCFTNEVIPLVLSRST